MDFTGVAIGSGVNQYMKMDEMARANKKLEMEKALADQSLAKGNFELDQLRNIDSINKYYQPLYAKVARGEIDDAAFDSTLDRYTKQFPGLNDGYTAKRGVSATGAPVVEVYDPKGGLHKTINVTPQDLLPHLRQMHLGELAGASSDYAFKNAALGQKDTELADNRRFREVITPQIHAADNATRLQAANISVGPQWANVNKPHVGSAIQMVDGNGNMVLVNPVTDYRGNTTYNQSQLPAGLKPIPRGAGANPYTTMTDIEKMDYKAYQDGIKELGPRPSDPTKAAQWDNASAALVSQHRVGHLIGGGQQGGPGFNVGALGGKPAAPAAAPTGTGLKKPVTADQFKGWTRTGVGDNTVITDATGKRMSGSDFERQYNTLPAMVDYKAPDFSKFKAYRNKDGSYIVDAPDGTRMTGQMFESQFGISPDRLR